MRKPCHENNGAAIFVGRAANLQNPFFFNVHTTVEYLNKNVFSCSNTFQILFLSVQGQAQKDKQKHNKEVCQVSSPLPLINYDPSKQ